MPLSMFSKVSLSVIKVQDTEVLRMMSQHTVLPGNQPFWGASADMDGDKSML